MTKGIVPVFDAFPEPAARAVSEVFLQPRKFVAGLAGEVPESDTESLVAVGTAFLGPRNTVPPTKDFALILDPHDRFGLPVAAEALLEAYNTGVMGFRSIFEEFENEAGPGKEYIRTFAGFSADAVNRGSLRTMASLAVFSTPEGYGSQLAVPQSVGSTAALTMRESMLSPKPQPEGAAEERLAKESDRLILTQHPIIHAFGLVFGARAMPAPATMERFVHGYVEDRS